MSYWVAMALVGLGSALLGYLAGRIERRGNRVLGSLDDDE